MLFGKKKNSVLLAPLSGRAAALDEVPDPVFAERILGDGVAVLPESDTVLSPANGTVSNVAETFHAFGVTTDDGLDVLIHIGIDTVKLGGQGFTPLVKEGDKVKAGTPLCQVDFATVKAAGFETWTPVVITNMDAVASMSVQPGAVRARETALIKYEVAK